ncbi:MAG: hypothetical protein IT371_15620 [Deltaproteobacteria bacterium]|nr:hypothetical protein [Deltaproteobacteria bacterium]
MRRISVRLVGLLVLTLPVSAWADAWDATAMGQLENALVRAGYGTLWGEVSQLVAPYHRQGHVRDEERQPPRWRKREFLGTDRLRVEGADQLQRRLDLGATVVSYGLSLLPLSDALVPRAWSDGALAGFGAEVTPSADKLDLRIFRATGPGSGSLTAMSSRSLVRGWGQRPLLALRREVALGQGEREEGPATYALVFGGEGATPLAPKGPVLQKVAAWLYRWADKRTQQNLVKQYRVAQRDKARVGR